MQPFIQSAYHRLAGLAAMQREHAGRNAEKTALCGKRYTEHAKVARQQAIAKKLQEAQAERALKGAERMQAEWRFRADLLADRALHYRVPNTRLGRFLLMCWHPLRTASGLLVWRELWCGGNYERDIYARESLKRGEVW